MIDLLIENGTVMTVDKQRRVIRGGDVAVEAGRIGDVGKSLRKKYRADRVVNAEHKLVMPGLINTHTHIITQLFKGMAPDSTNTPTFIPQRRSYFESLTPKDIYYATLLLCLELMKNGVTTFLDNGSYFYEETIKAVRETGMRALLGTWMADSAGLPTQGAQAELKNAESMLQACKNIPDNGKIRGWVTPLGTTHMSCSDELLVGSKKLADKYQVGLNMHAASSLSETKAYLEKKGRTPVRHLDRLGILGSNVSLIHVVFVDNEEIEILRNSGVSVIHCPTAALYLAKGLAKYGMIPEMISRGINVSLGTDSADTSNFHDMVRVMYLAALLFKDIRLDRSVMGAEQAIEMSTVNAARTFHSENEVGSIEVGKKADISIFDMKRPEWIPINNEVSNFVYSASGDSAHTVIVDGQILMENRKVATVNELEVLDQVQQLTKSLMSRAKIGSSPLKPPWNIL